MSLIIYDILYLGEGVGEVAWALSPTSISISVLFAQVGRVYAAHVQPSSMFVWV